MTLHDLCSVDELPVGKMKSFKVDGEKILLYHLEDGFYATQATCTHTFGPLARGKLVNGCEIRCPLHRARFDVRSGEVVEWANFPPGVQLLNVVRQAKALKTYPVSIKDGSVRVRL
jgi:3-phenylpropionate/trans-cinnamate dioxygenase ferredoxin subunit